MKFPGKANSSSTDMIGPISLIFPFSEESFSSNPTSFDGLSSARLIQNPMITTVTFSPGSMVTVSSTVWEVSFTLTPGTPMMTWSCSFEFGFLIIRPSSPLGFNETVIAESPVFVIVISAMKPPAAPRPLVSAVTFP